MARIQTTPAVRIALYVLRLYLIVLLLLIAVKFLRLFERQPEPVKKAAAVRLVAPCSHAVQGPQPRIN